MQIKASVNQLLEKLEEHKATHLKEREEALVIYRAKLEVYLEKKLEFINDLRNRVTELTEYPSEPGHPPTEIPDNTKEYDTALGMLRLHKEHGEEFVTLGVEDYKNYVEDNWRWAVHAKAIHFNYTQRHG